MAGDWIKMRTDLADDPAVVGMAAMLKTTEFDIVGRLHCLWSWADKHTTTGAISHINQKWIDKHVSKPGFAKSMCAVGWLICHENSVTFPRFERHNGASAKSRAETTERKRLSRLLRDKSETENGQVSQEKQVKNVTREEKRREEKSKPPIPTKAETVTTEVDRGVDRAIGVVDPETGEVQKWA